MGFQEEFIWSATYDYSSYLSVTACVSTMNALGPARVRRHCNSVVRAAAEGMRAAWWSNVADPPPFYLCPVEMNGTMICVRLPAGRFSADADGAGRLHSWLATQGIESVVFPLQTTSADGRGHEVSLWLRLSAQIYNKLSDYARLRDLIGMEHVGRK